MKLKVIGILIRNNLVRSGNTSVKKILKLEKYQSHYIFLSCGLKTTYLKESLYVTSQKISRILEELGKRDDLLSKFFNLWIKTQKDIKAIIFDITSLCSYSKLIEYIEWGYNRDSEKLAQVNLGLR